MSRSRRDMGAGTFHVYSDEHLLTAFRYSCFDGPPELAAGWLHAFVTES